MPQRLKVICFKNTPTLARYFLLSLQRGKYMFFVFFLTEKNLKHLENRIIMCNFCSDRSYDFPMGMFFSAHHSFCKASTKTLGGHTGWREVRPQQEKHLSAFDIALNSFLGFFPPTSLINLRCRM